MHLLCASHDECENLSHTMFCRHFAFGKWLKNSLHVSAYTHTHTDIICILNFLSKRQEFILIAEMFSSAFSRSVSSVSAGTGLSDVEETILLSPVEFSLFGHACLQYYSRLFLVLFSSLSSDMSDVRHHFECWIFHFPFAHWRLNIASLESMKCKYISIDRFFKTSVDDWRCRQNEVVIW